MHTNPEVLALLALGEDAGTPAERSHVRDCPDCSQEVAELAGIADIGRSSTMPEPMTSPSPEVWKRISAELGFDTPGSLLLDRAARDQADDLEASAKVRSISTARRNASAAAPAATSTGRGANSTRRFVSLALAAALALVVGIGVGIGYERNIAGPQDRVIAQAQLKATPQFPGVTGSAQVITNGRGKREIVVQMKSPTPIDGQTDVWLIDPDSKTPEKMGTMVNGEARIEVPRGMSLLQHPVIDISDEPANDTDTVHSGKSILQGRFV
jgi:hypothetical protein